MTLRWLAGVAACLLIVGSPFLVWGGIILVLTLTAATLAAVLLSGVLWESDATDYPEGNIHD